MSQLSSLPPPFLSSSLHSPFLASCPRPFGEPPISVIVLPSFTRPCRNDSLLPRASTLYGNHQGPCATCLLRVFSRGPGGAVLPTLGAAWPLAVPPGHSIPRGGRARPRAKRCCFSPAITPLSSTLIDFKMPLLPLPGSTDQGPWWWVERAVLRREEEGGVHP